MFNSIIFLGAFRGETCFRTNRVSNKQVVLQFQGKPFAFFAILKFLQKKRSNDLLTFLFWEKQIGLDVNRKLFNPKSALIEQIYDERQFNKLLFSPSVKYIQLLYTMPSLLFRRRWYVIWLLLLVSKITRTSSILVLRKPFRNIKPFG